MLKENGFKEIRNKPHRKLDLWKKSVDFSIEIYTICNSFPREEKYGLSSQLKRACISIPSNIAEGSSRQTKKEFIHFLYIARGSCSEVETLLEIAKRLDFISIEYKEKLDDSIINISRMITGLINYHKNKI